MTVQQLKKQIQDLKMNFNASSIENSIIIYDPEKGIPEFNDDKTRIFIPEDGRDPNFSILWKMHDGGY